MNRIEWKGTENEINDSPTNGNYRFIISVLIFSGIFSAA